MMRLLELGFKKVGMWKIADNGNIVFVLDLMANEKNVLYAFVCDGRIKYIGKSVRTLKERMTNYKTPGSSQRTNRKVNRLISDCLRGGGSVYILAFSDNGLLHYGNFHINLAAGLEDDLIDQIDPEWNDLSTKKIKAHGRKRNVSLFETSDGTFAGEIHLRKTYYKTGFFNMPVDFDSHVGEDKEEIKIYDDRLKLITKGHINRTANTNATARIMGGVGLRDWFQRHFNIGDVLRIEFIEKNAIKIGK